MLLCKDGTQAPVRVIEASAQRMVVHCSEALQPGSAAHIGYRIDGDPPRSIIAVTEVTRCTPGTKGCKLELAPKRVLCNGDEQMFRAFLHGHLKIHPAAPLNLVQPRPDAFAVDLTPFGAPPPLEVPVSSPGRDCGDEGMELATPTPASSVISPMSRSLLDVDAVPQLRVPKRKKNRKLDLEVLFQYGKFAPDGPNCQGRVYEVGPRRISVAARVDDMGRGDHVRMMVPVPLEDGRVRVVPIIGTVEWIMRAVDGMGFRITVNELHEPSLDALARLNVAHGTADTPAPLDAAEVA